jgi:FtsP/CotA-like multicopper oxidase with cupredoxin domain
MTVNYRTRHSELTRPSRRTFVKGLAMGGVAAGLGLWGERAQAQGVPRRETGVLSGTEFDLEIEETLVNFTGAPRFAHAVNRSIPAPILRWRRSLRTWPRARRRM